MAESLRKKVEEHLSCSVCLEHFRDPKVLPCLHTFCQQCIAKLDMTGNILTCPECRATTKVPFPPDVSFLPSNFFAKNLLATLTQTNDCGDAKKVMEPTSTQGATGSTPKPPTDPGSTQTSTKDDAKTAVKPTSTQGAEGPTHKPPTDSASKQTTKENAGPKSTAVASQGSPTKPAKSIFPRGSFVGDRIFRHGYHTWSVQIDHSDCHGWQSAPLEIGVISHVDGSTVVFHGYIKPGCCEEFEMGLDMYDDELSVEPSFFDEAIYFDVDSSRLSPYLKIDCKTCEIAVTEASFHWHFKEH